MRRGIRGYKTSGIVIRRVNMGEADKLITILTRYKGKIVVLAKGIRKITSRKAPHLELLTLVKLSIVSGKTWDYIIEAETIESFSYLRLSLEKIAWVYKIIEQTDRLVSEGLENRVIFDMLISILTDFNQTENLNFRNLTDFYSLNLLWELGYLPKGRQLAGDSLDKYMEQVMEKTLKSSNLLSKL